MASDLPAIVVGLQAEARIARKLGWRVAVGGGTPEGARRAAEKLVAQGATALVSFGLAGGLNPSLFPGDILVPAFILLDGARVPCDAALVRRLGGPTAHVLLAGEEIVVSAFHKRDICRETGAHAVDLETGPVARVALAHNLPFAVLRAICDPANCSLPPAAQVALDRNGAIGFFRVLGSILRHPSQIKDLRELAVDAQAARTSLTERIALLTAS